MIRTSKSKTTEEGPAMSMHVSGPGSLNVLAGLGGSDTITRVEIAEKKARLTVQGEGIEWTMGGTSGPGSQESVVMYLLKGRRGVVHKYDEVMRRVEVMLALQGPEKFLRDLIELENEQEHSRKAHRSRYGRRRSEPEIPPQSAPPHEEPSARRWAALKDQLLRENPVAPGRELGKITGSTATNLSERASKWRRDGKVFAVNNGREDVFPLFQIQENKPAPVVETLLKLLRPKLTDWEIFAWFGTPDEWACNGDMPKNLLTTDPDAVIEAARHQTAESWD